MIQSGNESPFLLGVIMKILNSKYNLQFLATLLGSVTLLSCNSGNNQGLQNMPDAGMYNGVANSSKYQSGTVYGIVSNQNQFGTATTVVQLVMNFNNQFMGMMSGTLTQTFDTTACLSGSDLVSESPTSLSVTSATVTFSNCSWQNGQFSANYAVYKKSGAEMDSGSLQIAVNPSCNYYPVTVTSLPNGNYSGGIQSCLTLESGILGGNITNSAAMLFTNFGESSMIESGLFESSIIVGTANTDYSTMLTESMTMGPESGFITPFYITNINNINGNVTANYLSYYDYGTFQTTVGQ